MPTVRDAIRKAYFTVVELASPVLPLKATTFARFFNRMKEMKPKEFRMGK